MPPRLHSSSTWLTQRRVSEKARHLPRHEKCVRQREDGADAEGEPRARGAGQTNTCVHLEDPVVTASHGFRNLSVPAAGATESLNGVSSGVSSLRNLACDSTQSLAASDALANSLFVLALAVRCFYCREPSAVF